MKVEILISLSPAQVLILRGILNRRISSLSKVFDDDQLSSDDEYLFCSALLSKLI